MTILAINSLGNGPFPTPSPFLFAVYHYDIYPPSTSEKPLGIASKYLRGKQIGADFNPNHDFRMYHGTNQIPGFPAHPHRGFETITVVQQGAIDHADSLGASGRFKDGDIQWMTAGKGVQHSEMFPLLSSEKENVLELFQIWLNLPKRSKFVEPHYKMLWREEVPIISVKDSQGNEAKINVVAGNWDGSIVPIDPTPDSYAADESNKVGVYTIEMDPGVEWTIPPTSPRANRSLYFYKGDALFLFEDDEYSKKVSSMSMMEVKPDVSLKIKNSPQGKGYLLVLEGIPIQEPVVQHGPFVMNTRQEIMEAFQDYQTNQFGGWPWESEDPVFGLDKGRFAKHANGKEEIRKDEGICESK